MDDYVYWKSQTEQYSKTVWEYDGIADFKLRDVYLRLECKQKRGKYEQYFRYCESN